MAIDVAEVREFSETLHYGRLVRYRPQEFVNKVNRWLLAHPGIVGINAVLQRDSEGVRNITFTCRAILDSTPLRVQMACLPLRSEFGRRLYKDPGQALTIWADANPLAHRLNHWIFAASGNASEVWVLYVVPAEAVETSFEGGIVDVGEPPKRVLTTAVHMLYVVCLLGIAFLLLGFVVVVLIPQGAPSRNGELIGQGSLIAILFGTTYVLRRFRRLPVHRSTAQRPR